MTMIKKIFSNYYKIYKTYKNFYLNLYQNFPLNPVSIFAKTKVTKKIPLPHNYQCIVWFAKTFYPLTSYVCPYPSSRALAKPATPLSTNSASISSSVEEMCTVLSAWSTISIPLNKSKRCWCSQKWFSKTSFRNLLSRLRKSR
jgi:hypothetical protein